MTREWYQPTADGRWPIPHSKFWPDDICVTVGYAQRSARLADALIEAFVTNHDVALWATALETNPRLVFQSSQKYTHIVFPHIASLREKFLLILDQHGLMVDPAFRPMDFYEFKYSTIRTGIPDETIYFGEPRALSNCTRT